MLATGPALPPEGTGVESDARRVPLGQTLPKRDVRDTSVYPSNSDMTLRRSERRKGPISDIQVLRPRDFPGVARGDLDFSTKIQSRTARFKTVRAFGCRKDRGFAC